MRASAIKSANQNNTERKPPSPVRMLLRIDGAIDIALCVKSALRIGLSGYVARMQASPPDRTLTLPMGDARVFERGIGIAIFWYDRIPVGAAGISVVSVAA